MNSKRNEGVILVGDAIVLGDGVILVGDAIVLGD